MKRSPRESFPTDIARKLRWYVYRLIDLRNGETFYVGKGQGNRVSSLIRAEQGLDGDDLDNKIKRIRKIRLAGFEVAHVIHRHGMDEKTAFEVEAALIDAYPGLTNVAGGRGRNDYGAMHAKGSFAATLPNLQCSGTRSCSSASIGVPLRPRCTRPLDTRGRSASLRPSRRKSFSPLSLWRVRIAGSKPSMGNGPGTRCMNDERGRVAV
ncbi:uncharacterized protein HKBW3S44_00810 [Candidatus Hakubella thermalkaliphila]|nr:hypothetical protein [Candidatus Hakubella thermalkaliphila]GFP37130.1 uncharacterized protein HKBW3S44_00810 [Candidatus Hakubella thermalkaliphila]